MLVVCEGHSEPGPGLGSRAFSFFWRSRVRGEAPASCPSVTCSRHVPHSEAGMPGWSLPGRPTPEMSCSLLAWVVWTGRGNSRLSRWFSPFLFRTRKMGSQRLSSSETARRKVRSTGKAPAALLKPDKGLTHVLPTLRSGLSCFCLSTPWLPCSDLKTYLSPQLEPPLHPPPLAT